MSTTEATAAPSAALIKKIKDGQRVSEEWRLSWANYCDVFGERKRDPAAHDDKFLQEFIDRHSQIKFDAPPPAEKEPRERGPRRERGERGERSSAAPAQAKAQPVDPSSEHEELVQKVKEYQRTPGGRQMWEQWCMTSGGKGRDPARNDVPFLQKFLFLVGIYDPFTKTTTTPSKSTPQVSPLAMMMPGMQMMPSMLAAGGGIGNNMATVGPVKAKLVDQIKDQQRNESAYRQAWSDYCSKYGKNQLDPMRHDVAFLHQFVQMQTPDAKPPASIRLSKAPDNFPGISALAMDQDRLVQQIKEGQRNSPEFKQAWWDWCEKYGGRQRDPAKQTPLFLSEFLSTRNTRSVTFVHRDDPERQGLVNRIKEGQKKSPEWKEAWVQYCRRGDRDPNLHSTESLERFIEDNQHLLPQPALTEA